MWVETACEALRRRKVLELHYGGFSRSIEVHAVGWTKLGHAVLRGWQVSGGAGRGEKLGWKLLELGEASGAELSPQGSEAPRPGYKRGDAAMVRIIGEV
jgi:hypothetical protein